MAAPNEFWLLTVPKEGQTPEATFEKLRRHTDGASQGYLIQVPSLTVGTLNSLMSLSEDMDKVDASIESVVRKVERQYAEVTPKTRDPLLVDAVPIDRYLPSFVWEHAKYPHRRALPELVQHLRQTVSETDDELKHLASTYADKTGGGPFGRRRREGQGHRYRVSCDRRRGRPEGERSGVPQNLHGDRAGLHFK